jgi:hypothetical protein
MTPRPLTLLSLNAYLVPPFFQRHGPTDPVGRAEGLGCTLRAFAPALDLVFLQEYWGPGLDKFHLAVSETFHVASRYESFLGQYWNRSSFYRSLCSALPQWFITAVDTARLGGVPATGGLAYFSRMGLKPLVTWSQTFSISATKSRKGVMGTLWDMSTIWGSSRKLMVFSTHLDAFHVENRRHQLAQAVKFIDNVVQEEIAAERIRPDNTAILLLGDFNIIQGSDEYHQTLQQECQSTQGARMVDFCDEVYGPDNDILTFDPANSLTQKPGNFGRIDYILGINSLRIGGQTVQLMPLKCLEWRTVKQPPQHELSDHWAIFVKLLPKG